MSIKQDAIYDLEESSCVFNPLLRSVPYMTRSAKILFLI